MNFQDVKEFLENVPDIHCGGCGISAISMILWKEKYWNIDRRNVWFVLNYGEHGWGYEENSTALSTGKPEELIIPSHIGILEETYDEGKAVFYDCVTKQETDCFHLVDFSTLTIMVKNRGEWNECFDRNIWVPIIQDKLGIDLSLIN